MSRIQGVGTNATPKRATAIVRYPMRDGRTLTVYIRDTIVVEDPYLKLVKAKLYSVRTGNPFMADMTDRTIKDSLIKVNIQI
jgi:hypothetical protein